MSYNVEIRNGIPIIVNDKGVQIGTVQLENEEISVEDIVEEISKPKKKKQSKSQNITYDKLVSIEAIDNDTKIKFLYNSKGLDETNNYWYMDLINLTVHHKDGSQFKPSHYGNIQDEWYKIRNFDSSVEWINLMFWYWDVNMPSPDRGDKYSKFRDYVIKFISPENKKGRIMEILAKAGIKISISDRNYNWIEIDIDQTKPHKILKVSKWLLPFLKDNNTDIIHMYHYFDKYLDVNMYKYILTTYGSNKNNFGFNVYHLKRANENDNYLIELISFGYDWKTVVDYVNRDCRFQGLDVRNAYELLRDYARMSRSISDDYDRYPRYLSSLHDVAAMNYKAIQDEETNKKIQEIAENNKYLEFENEKFQLIYPTSATEIIEEGTNMNHCVASYVNDVVEGKTHILFLRRKENLEKSYVTVEVNNRYEFIQAKGNCNSKPEVVALDFITNYRKKILSKLQEKIEKN